MEVKAPRLLPGLAKHRVSGDLVYPSVAIASTLQDISDCLQEKISLAY